MRELVAWLDEPDPDTFPYESVVDGVRRVGKHYVPRELLEALDKARAATPEPRLCRFLDTVLDKYDDRYDYLSYLALDLLSMPAVTDDPAVARRRADQLVVALVADVARFEVAVRDGETDLLPQQRPDAATVAKRLRLASRAMAAARGRVGADVPDTRVLSVSMLPVDTLHDEYLFIRVLQAFETTFALLAVLLRSTVDSVLAADAAAAQRFLTEAADALGAAAPLFSLLATMRVSSFRTFRANTEGASAIQSRNYKLVESLCRRPDPARLDSVAYRSVPEIRAGVLTGQSTVDDALTAVTRAGRLTPAAIAAVTEAMTRFATALTRWRQTHYRLAVRMLGDQPGTGYTQGTPYLSEARAIPVF